MAVPKQRTPRSSTRKRRSAWKAQRPELATVQLDGRTYRVPYQLVPAYRRGLLPPPDQP
ncbi:50S ribosomal protein L32 [Streptomonospora nanhaiensis]|uniref:Large ribosomal subunit protein bL32 n=1 Tax=Streptomonospora nanhaiensis TaxID=1323731 RepID=A0A853BV32_9ACTN|nr:50S ribosomal protein L32 [Streptomonospora nanhaiensis]MBV2364498.1 50S ribosomal protein L32 [Streptomonospora nanhaiensis]MBX9388029.1 50S ribosomal protein L32 [Streptomonospora nanhaiensis]NYI99158.1 large subunit ribosomal protein L32 [Streptomonospora nanhaiensis]